MALYDMTGLKADAQTTGDSLVELTRTSFAAQQIQERQHLQAALRDRIELIDGDLFVVAEEFGDFEGVLRRIDLLCLDRDCRLVVVELKRTADGGHMELQALRYAAMVSTMTFVQVVRTLAKYRGHRGIEDDSEATARADLLAWVGLDDDEEAVVAREVGIVLASEDFSQEITTTVLWLNDLHGTDIRCVRMTPYLLGDRLLLDVQHVIPLPEASAYTVRVREKETAARQAVGEASADRTKFVVTTPFQVTAPLPKRWAMLRLVEDLHRAGVAMDVIQAVLPPSKLLLVEGVHDDADARWHAVRTQLGRPDGNRGRWHLDDAIADGDRTWIVNNNWGTRTRALFADLLAIAPSGFAVAEEGELPVEA